MLDRSTPADPAAPSPSAATVSSFLMIRQPLSPHLPPNHAPVFGLLSSAFDPAAPDDVAAPTHPLTHPPIHRRALWAFILFCIGLVTARYFSGIPGPFALALASGCAVIAALTRGRACVLALALAAALIGHGWFGVRVLERPADSLALWLPTNANPRAPIPVVFHGRIIESPRTDPGTPDRQSPGRGRGPSTSFRLLVQHAESEKGLLEVRGIVTVLIRDEVPDTRAGDRVRLRGEFLPLRPPINPGEDDERLWGAQEDRVGRLTVSSRDLVEPLPPDPGAAAALAPAIERTLASLRATAASWLDVAISDEDDAPARSMLSVLLIGREDRALVPVTEAFTRLGLVHILSISGFHLVVMAGLAGVLVRLTGDRGLLEPLLVAILVIVYLLVVPAKAPVLRAGFMVLIFLAAELLGRRYDRLNLLSWIAILLLLWRPMDLFAPGFQLSFGVTAALLTLGVQFNARCFGPALKGGVVRAPRSLLGVIARAALAFIQASASTSLLAWAVSAPLVAFHAGVLTPLAPLTGFLLTFIFTLVMWAGYIAIVLAAAWAPLGEFAGVILSALGSTATFATIWLDGLPAMTIGLPRVSLLWTVAATAVAFAWIITPPRNDHLGTPRRWLATTIVVSWLALSCATASRLPQDELLSIDHLPGSHHQAEGTLLIRAGSQCVLILPSTFSPGDLRRSIPAAVRDLGAWRVRTIVLGSSPPDAAAQIIPELAARLGVTDLLVPATVLAVAAERPGSPQAALVAQCQRRGVRLRARAATDTLGLSPGIDLTLDGASWRLTATSGAGSQITVDSADLFAQSPPTADSGHQTYQGLRVSPTGARTRTRLAANGRAEPMP